MRGNLLERRRSDHAAWRKRAAQARARNYAEWARVEKRLRPYVSGLECVHNMLSLWEVYNLDGIIPKRDIGYTLPKLAALLDSVAEVEVWHSDCPVEALSEMPWPRRQGGADELWQRLMELQSPTTVTRNPVMVALATDWTIVQLVNPENGRVALYDRYRQELELPAFRLKWDMTANIALLVTSLKRDKVSSLDWTCLIPQLELKPPGDLQDYMDSFEDPPGVETALEHYAGLSLDAKHCPKVTKENLRLIGKALLALPDDVKKNSWAHIVKGGLRGYASYLNGLVRVGWCFEQVPPFNPCSSLDARRAYPVNHPLALIAEHKFLRIVALSQTWKTLAQSSDHNFTIKELVLANPLTQDPQEDWRTIEAFDAAGRHVLKKEDMVEWPGMVEAAKAWYEQNGFTRD